MKKSKGSKHQRAFLAAFRSTASITKSAEAAKINRTLHYQWLADDEAYPQLFEVARNEAAQTLEDEAVRRAHEGVLNPVFYKGKPCGVVREFSDSLLQFLLKAFRPEKYRDRNAVEVTNHIGGAIPLEAQALQTLDKDELALLADLARKIASAPRPGSGTEETKPEQDR